jgi:hypothetical protein
MASRELQKFFAALRSGDPESVEPWLNRFGCGFDSALGPCDSIAYSVTDDRRTISLSHALCACAIVMGRNLKQGPFCFSIFV